MSARTHTEGSLPELTPAEVFARTSFRDRDLSAVSQAGLVKTADRLGVRPAVGLIAGHRGVGPVRSSPSDRLEAERDRFDPAVPVVTICGKGGGRSESAARLLRERGFRDVRSLCGGTEAWRRLR